jgi:hypothetical protein
MLRVFSARDQRQAASDRGGVRLLADQPIKDPAYDYFGFMAFAVALAEIVDNESTDTPLTIAVSAPWGAGKTSVASLMEHLLQSWVLERDGDRARIPCWFNAWANDDAPHLGAALAASVARVASKHRSPLRRLLEPLPTAMIGPQERWWRSIKIAAVALAAASLLGLLHSTRRLAEQVLHIKEGVVGGAGWLAALLVVVVLWRHMFAAAKNAARFVDDPQSEAARGSMAQVQAQLGRLIKHATRSKGRIVIFVDDLERCRPARAVEVFEVSSQLLAHPGVVTVLLADMRAISSAAEAAYGDGRLGTDPDVGRRYLEKLVQLELELPPPSEDAMRQLLRGEQPDVLRSTTPRETKTASDSGSAMDSGTAYAKGSTGPSWRPVTLAAWRKTAAGLTAAAGSIAALEFTGQRIAGGATTSATVALGATIVGALATVYASTLQEHRRRRRRAVEEELESTLRDHPEAEGTRFGPQDPQWRDAVKDEKLDAYASRVAENILTEHSVTEVEKVIEHHPPRFPRGAKRMLNHARLLTRIARERGMFGGEPELSAQHLGKWIVLRERWPTLARYVEEHPSDLEQFEMGHPAGTLPPEVTASDVELIQLLRTPPLLGNVINRLIYFEPAVAAQRSSAAEP